MAVRILGYLQEAMTASTQTIAIRRFTINKRAAWITGALLVLIIAGVIAYEMLSAGNAQTYLTQPVVRQTLAQTVSASGTVNPQNTIAIGSQVSGIISQIYVDFNSKVKKGEVLAKLDPSTLQSQVDAANASIAQASAQVSTQANAAAADIAGIAAAQANAVKAQSALTLAQTTLTRDTVLFKQGYVAQNQVQIDTDAVTGARSSLQSAQSAASQAASQARGGNAGIAAAQANVASQEAQAEQARLNLNRSIITSPVDGTVIGRDVSVGQTVAASLQTPTLFTIAQDLTKMEVDIAVGEPDIGAVKSGELVSFTVLAYPNRTFSGTVSQVRKDPTTVSNVVTYTVITKVDNKDGALLPGMTATATINVATAKNALVVPVAALQWHPAGGSGSGTHRRDGATGTTGANATAKTGTPAAASNASPWGSTSGSSSQTIAAGNNASIFVQNGNKLQRVAVHVDLVAGTQAAVTPAEGATLNENDLVVIGTSGGSRTQRAGSSSAFGNSSRGATRGIH